MIRNNDHSAEFAHPPGKHQYEPRQNIFPGQGQGNRKKDPYGRCSQGKGSFLEAFGNRKETIPCSIDEVGHAKLLEVLKKLIPLARECRAALDKIKLIKKTT